MAVEFVSRRHLPHWCVAGAFHFVTYRLAGTIPQCILDELATRTDLALKQQLASVPIRASIREAIHKTYFAEFDRYLDNQREIRWLEDPRIAKVVRDNLYFHRGTKYELSSYCVMPNHVHVLLKPLEQISEHGDMGQAGLPVLRTEGQAGLPVLRTEGQAGLPVLRTDEQSPLSAIMHSLKSYTANQANKLLGRKGEFWQDESYDHWVRDEEELERIVAYIAQNPVKAGLVKEPHEWHCCAARDRYLHDGSRAAWLLP